MRIAIAISGSKKAPYEKSPAKYKTLRKHPHFLSDYSILIFTKIYLIDCTPFDPVGPDSIFGFNANMCIEVI